MRRLWMLSATAVVLCAANLPAQGEDARADERKLKDAYQDTDSKSLVEFLKTRARGSADAKEVDALIAKLGDKDASVRDKASQQLIAIGAPAVPKLRLTGRDPKDDDTAVLARKLLKVLEDDPGNVTGAAVRLLAARRAEGTAEALLAYLPHAENESVMDDINTTLAAVAYIKGKPDPALLKALEDAHPLRRASAITALCAGGIAEPRATLRKLMTDKSPSVRLRATLALSRASDAKAVSALIALLGDLRSDQGREVEQFLTDLAGDQAPKVTIGDDDRSRQKARDAWATWWLQSDGPKLIKELEKRTLTEEAAAKANRLIETLGDHSADARRSAEADLKKMGPRVMPLLKAARASKNPEVRKRSAELLKTLASDPNTALSPVVPRLLALRKPKGTAEALLAYLPAAEDESLREEVQAALNAVTFATGKADPAVIKALGDKAPARRAAAAVALCHGPLADHMGDIRKRLDPKTEKDNTVRLRVALALAAVGEKEGIESLIKLMEDLPAEQASAAEDFLYRLARGNPPKDLPADGGNQKERAAAWRKWWEDNEKQVVMIDRFTPEMRARYMGYVLLIQAGKNQIVELDKDNKMRMTMTGLLEPHDAQWIGQNRLLVAEHGGLRVTERDLKGNIIWEKKLPFRPMQAERLRNGHTFIVGQNVLLQVDRAGRKVLKIDRSNDSVRTARRLPNGQIVLITSKDRYVRCDASGKELKSANLSWNVDSDQNEILDNGNVLVPLGANNTIKEYNQEGKEVWSAAIEGPLHAFRLPNRNTLVSLQSRGDRFRELDRNGKEIRQHATNAPAFRIKGR